MDSEKSSLNPSSILDLKAELHKKYVSFNRAKLSQKSDSNRPIIFKNKDQLKPKEKKTQTKITLKPKDDISEEELKALKKSQLALEAKTKLYEKITSSNTLIDDEENEKYLVDFQRKILYSTPLPPKNELTENKPSVSQENITSTHSSETLRETNFKKSTINNNQNYCKEENKISSSQNSHKEENQTNQPIHYQNVLFSEVRDHGTGYYAFSTDESKRKEQMEELKKMRQQTEEQRLIAQRLQKKRKASLEARLAKVCERRNIDKCVVQTYTNKEESAEDPYPDQNIDLSSIPLPETPEVSEKKEVKIRPWDIGKTNFTPFVPEKKRTKSQNDWIEDRRSDRPSEFAPPSYY